MMIKFEELKNKLDNDVYNVYSSVFEPNMQFPAIVLTPSTQVPDVNLASFANRILEYNWTLVILDKVESYDDITEAMDGMWLLAESIPNLLGVKITESVPFGHVKDNNKLFCIEFKVKSRL